MAHDEGRLLVIYKLEQFNPILKEEHGLSFFSEDEHI